MEASPHQSVLAHEVIDILELKKGLTVVDGTLGLGGHAELILEKITPGGFLFGFEWDAKNAEFAEKRLKKYQKNCKIIRKSYICLAEEAKEADRIIFDFGLSSVHLDSSGRGFSVKKDEPLDMRMSEEIALTAQEIVNEYSEEDLRNILWRYGEEQEARKISHNIIQNRPLTTTQDLVRVIEQVKKKTRFGGGHPAVQTFQAFRIAVNNELTNVEIGLQKALQVLKKDGIIAAISFHSLEDRIVKNLFRELSRPCICPKEFPVCLCQDRPRYQLLTRKAITPSAQEIAVNPRSRSAKLRAIKKLSS